MEFLKDHYNINTQGKIYKIAKVTQDDCKKIDDFMTKYSRYEHHQPDESPVALPEPDELEADLKELQKWRDDFETR